MGGKRVCHDIIEQMGAVQLAGLWSGFLDVCTVLAITLILRLFSNKTGKQTRLGFPVTHMCVLINLQNTFRV